MTRAELLNCCDGETVYPPELVGDYPGLAEWSMDALAALVLDQPIPNPKDYKSKP